MFGPIQFADLDSDSFDGQKQRNRVQKMVESKTVVAEPGNQIFVHGYRVMVKGRTLKRRTSILKHSRYLKNLVVSPVYPEPIVEVDDAEGDEEEVNE
jgi:hypothetical protein